MSLYLVTFPHSSKWHLNSNSKDRDLASNKTESLPVNLSIKEEKKVLSNAVKLKYCKK